MAKLAEKYEAGIEAAIVGYHEADAAARHAAESVCEFAGAHPRYGPVGMVGLTIYARALLASQEACGDHFVGRETYLKALGAGLAKALTEIHERT